jgi:FHA domain-containing protein
MTRLWWAIAAVVLVLGMPLGMRPAAAQPADSANSNRAVIDRIDLEPSSLTGQRLRVYLSAIALGGTWLDLELKQLKTTVNGAELKAAFAGGAYSGTTTETVIVIVVQATVEYADVLPVIAEALDQNVLAALGEHTQIALLPYGGSIGTGKLMSLKTARGKVPGLSSDGSGGDPALLETIERALGLLKKAKTEPPNRPVRKMILAIGDGRDANPDRDRVRKIGERAAKEGVRIHAFGFTPSNTRRPLLLLGELSKRSLGTFRWVRGGKAESWVPALQQLRDEIGKEYVLTYFLGADEDVAGKKLKIAASGRVVVTSNEAKIPSEPTCNGEPCAGYCGEQCVVLKPAQSRGILAWILILLGFAVAGILLLSLVGFILSKRQPAIVPPPGFPLPGSQPPGVQPTSGRPASIPAPVVPSAPPAPVAPVQAPIVGPKLYIMTGPRTGETIALRHGFSIGKAPGNDLLIDDGYTSGQHAQIAMDHFGNCRVYDRGSTNGTFINGVRITEYGLEHGNTLRIGSTDLRFLAQ